MNSLVLLSITEYYQNHILKIYFYLRIESVPTHTHTLQIIDKSFASSLQHLSSLSFILYPPSVLTLTADLDYYLQHTHVWLFASHPSHSHFTSLIHKISPSLSLPRPLWLLPISFFLLPYIPSFPPSHFCFSSPPPYLSPLLPKLPSVVLGNTAPHPSPPSHWLSNPLSSSN